MSVQFEGKTPGRAWHLWQNLKGLSRTPFDPGTKPAAKKLGLHSGLAVVAPLTILKIIIPCVAIVPFSGVALTSIAAISCVGFAISGFRKFQDIKKSVVVTNYVKEQKKKWAEKKSRPKLGTRLLLALQNTVKKPLTLFPRLGTLLGYGLAVAGAAAASIAGLKIAGATAVTSLLAKAVPAAVLTAVTAATGMVLPMVPVVIGLAAIPVGITAALLCKKLTRKMDNAPVTAKEKPSFYKVPKNDNTKAIAGKSPSPSFEKAAAPTSAEVNETRRKAAEARAAARKAAKHTPRL